MLFMPENTREFTRVDLPSASLTNAIDYFVIFNRGSMVYLFVSPFSFLILKLIL